MLRRCFILSQGTSRAEKGLYFPINHRIIDKRVAPSVVFQEAELQSRYRRELRSNTVTGETRQVEVPIWSQKVPPTHFLSLRLPQKNALTTRVKQMNDSIIFTHPRFSELAVPLERLHVTLGVFTFDKSNPTRCTTQDIQDCVTRIFSSQPPIQLRFRGLGTFSHGRVLFVRAITEAHFTTLDKLVRETRMKLGRDLGIDVKGNPFDSYVPHVTVAKIRPAQKKEFGNNIPLEMWAPFQHQDFGDVTFSTVDLCNMKGRSENGYYKVESSTVMGEASA